MKRFNHLDIFCYQDAKRHGKTAAVALLEANGGLLVADPRLAAVKQA